MAKKSKKKQTPKKPIKKPLDKQPRPIIPLPFRSEMLSSKNILAILLGLVILAVIINLRYNSETTIVTTTTTNIVKSGTEGETTTTTQSVKSSGKLIVALKNDDTTLPGGTVIHELNFTVTKIEVYKESGEWIDLSSEQINLNLLDYMENAGTVAESDVEEGAYEKVRLGMSDGSISITNTFFYIYSPKEYDMIVPSEMTVDHTFNITTDKTLTLILNFDIRNSVRRTGVEYTMDPITTVTEQ